VLYIEYRFYGAKSWTIGKVNEKQLKCKELWWWRRMENSWRDIETVGQEYPTYGKKKEG
jgi:hypothetical protein